VKLASKGRFRYAEEQFAIPDNSLQINQLDSNTQVLA
jgi:hypothetical protein